MSCIVYLYEGLIDLLPSNRWQLCPHTAKYTHAPFKITQGHTSFLSSRLLPMLQSVGVCVCVCPQIARKRHKVINTFKSPLGQTRPPPPLKHITLMPLSQIRRVLDLQDTEGNTATAHTLQNKDAAAHHFVCMSFQGVFSSCNTAQCWKPRQANSGRSHFPVCSFKNALRSESAAKHHLIPEVYFRRVPQQT